MSLHVTNKQMSFDTIKVLLFRPPFVYQDVITAINDIISNRPFTLSIQFCDTKMDIQNADHFAEAERVTNNWDGEVIWKVIVEEEKAVTLMRRFSGAIGKKKEKKEKMKLRETMSSPRLATETERFTVTSSDGTEENETLGDVDEGEIEEDMMENVPVENIFHGVSSEIVENLLFNAELTVLLLEETFSKDNFPTIQSAVFQWYEMSDDIQTLLYYCVKYLVENTTDAKILFRYDNGPLVFVSKYMEKKGHDFRVKLLKPILKQYLESDNSDADEYCSKIIHHLLSNPNSIPGEIRKILSLISRVTSEKFPALKYLGIANFLFLRFIVPAIATPSAYGVLKVKNPKKGKRLIALASKMQSCISSSVNDSQHTLSLELAVLFARVADFRENNVNYVNTMNVIASQITQHDLISVISKHEKKTGKKVTQFVT